MQTKYSCQCGHTESRSINGWSIECPKCFSMMHSEPTGDWCLCSYCGKTHLSHVRQCSCGATQLVHAYEDEPLTNATVIKEVKSCIVEGITTRFQCKECGRIHDVYRTTQSHCFCVACGSLMGSTPNLKSYREGKRWPQALMADEVGISRKHYINIEAGKCQMSPKLALRVTEIMGTKAIYQG